MSTLVLLELTLLTLHAALPALHWILLLLLLLLLACHAVC
jgi:hypothetical protein